jgi:2-phospho-L-lactate guanylyltransferase
VLVPVRGGDAGKTRLTRIEGVVLSASDRAALTLAMARDTVRAAVAADIGTVAVLTADPAVSVLARSWGATVVSDLGRGLNPELAAAAASVDRRVGVCALLGDLPALTPAALDAALEAAQRVPGRGAFVPDLEGVGTAMVALRPATVVADAFRFGPGSAARHEAAGLEQVGLDLVPLRCDVDTSEAWHRARAVGLGPATSALRTRIVEGHQPAPTTDPGMPYAAGMAQGSVHTFEPSTGAGSVLLDDGEEVSFSAEAFAESGLRLLRPGQRVSLEQDGDGVVRRVFIRGIGEGESIR